MRSLPFPARVPSVERRHGRRIALASTALVFRRGQAIRLGSIRDLSLSGLYLYVDGPLLPRYATVELGFNVGRPGRMHFARLPAMVVRADDVGVGMRFDAVDPATQAAVRGVLRSAQGLASG